MVAARREMSLSEFIRCAADEVSDRALDMETRLEQMIEHLEGAYPEAAESLRELRKEVKP